MPTCRAGFRCCGTGEAGGVCVGGIHCQDRGICVPSLLSTARGQMGLIGMHLSSESSRGEQNQSDFISRSQIQSDSRTCILVHSGSSSVKEFHLYVCRVIGIHADWLTFNQMVYSQKCKRSRVERLVLSGLGSSLTSNVQAFLCTHARTGTLADEHTRTRILAHLRIRSLDLRVCEASLDAFLMSQIQ